MLMELSMLVTGKMINKKDMAKRSGWMELSMSDNIWPEKNMALVNFNGRMGHNMKGNFRIIICKINIYKYLKPW